MLTCKKVPQNVVRLTLRQMYMGLLPLWCCRLWRLGQVNLMPLKILANVLRIRVILTIKNFINACGTISGIMQRLFSGVHGYFRRYAKANPCLPPPDNSTRSCIRWQLSRQGHLCVIHTTQIAPFPSEMCWVTLKLHKGKEPTANFYQGVCKKEKKQKTVCGLVTWKSDAGAQIWECHLIWKLFHPPSIPNVLGDSLYFRSH